MDVKPKLDRVFPGEWLAMTVFNCLVLLTRVRCVVGEKREEGEED